MNNYSIVYLAFGKRDGFEILFQNQLLEDFEKKEDQDMLYNLIQLKLEEVRIFPDSEILGAIHFKHQGNWYKVFTLYRYTLDIYKRDGYYAGAIILKNSKARAEDLWGLLQAISQRAKLKITNQEGEFRLPGIAISPDGVKREVLAENKSALIQLKGNNSQLFKDGLEEMMSMSKVPFRTTYLTASERIINHCDPNRVDIIWHPRLSPPKIVEKQIRPVEENRSNNIKEDSLIFEYEAAEDSRWDKMEKSHGKKTNSLSRILRFFSL